MQQAGARPYVETYVRIWSRGKHETKWQQMGNPRWLERKEIAKADLDCCPTRIVFLQF
jgi:hypothetical protein